MLYLYVICYMLYVICYMLYLYVIFSIQVHPGYGFLSENSVFADKLVSRSIYILLSLLLKKQIANC